MGRLLDRAWLAGVSRKRFGVAGRRDQWVGLVVDCGRRGDRRSILRV